MRGEMNRGEGAGAGFAKVFRISLRAGINRSVCHWKIGGDSADFSFQVRQWWEYGIGRQWIANHQQTRPPRGHRPFSTQDGQRWDKGDGGVLDPVVWPGAIHHQSLEVQRMQAPVRDNDHLSGRMHELFDGNHQRLIQLARCRAAG